MGHRHLPSMAPAAGSLHLTSHTIRPPDPKAPALERPPTERHRPTCHTHLQNNQASQPASTGFNYPDQAARKIEARLTSKFAIS